MSWMLPASGGGDMHPRMRNMPFPIGRWWNSEITAQMAGDLFESMM